MARPCKMADFAGILFLVLAICLAVRAQGRDDCCITNHK